MKLLIYGMTEDEKKTLAEIRQQVDVEEIAFADGIFTKDRICLLYTSPGPRDA